MRIILLAALATVVLAVPVSAQQSNPPPNAPARAAPAAASMNGQWRASKLIGVDVYNQQNEKLGEINELIVDHSGRVAGAVIGVGGFLGMGERNILVAMDKLQFRDNDRRGTTGTGADRDWYPDRAVMNANKDQLKAMPEFKY